MKMTSQAWIAVVVLFSCAHFGVSSSGQKRVCYYTNWSQFRPAPARFTVASVDPFLCTHLVYAFAHFDQLGDLRPLLGASETATYAEFNGLKSANPDLKTLLAVGGWTFGSSRFSKMAADPVTRGRFVSSVTAFLRQHGFDGLDLDWEYPGTRGGSAADKDNFVILCKELKYAFQQEDTANSTLILSAAVSAARYIMDTGYNVKALDRYLDLWNLMTYDYHGPWAGKTGHNSPLYSSKQEQWARSANTVEWTAEEYVRRGASKHKVMVGLPAYGRSFRLKSTRRTDPGVTASLGEAGPYTREPGHWAYHEVCKKMAEGSGKLRRDEQQRVPYYVSGALWISFDDVESIKEKTRWLKTNAFGGYMLWSLDMDVFTPDLCPSASSLFPLLAAANSVLSEPGGPQIVVPEAATIIISDPGTGSGSGSGSNPGDQTGTGSQAGSGTQPTTGGSQTSSGLSAGAGGSQGGSKVFSCTGKEYKNYKDPESPCSFIVCFADTLHKMSCPPTLLFDPQEGICDHFVGGRSPCP